jgi:hypothetical protein
MAAREIIEWERDTADFGLQSKQYGVEFSPGSVEAAASN